MAHRRARLTPLGRLVVVERVLIHGWPAARVAEAASVSRPTVYKWVRRFLEEGEDGSRTEPRHLTGALGRSRRWRSDRSWRHVGA